MKASTRRILITGGAGFIGSHLCDRFTTRNHQVTVLDNLSTSVSKHIAPFRQKANIHFILGDCTHPSDVQAALKDVDIVVHLAANPEVRLDRNNPQTCFRQNVYATHVLLEAMRHSRAHTLVFTSTSTVYGDVDRIPTPETHPTRPISLYGAAKLASEALITAYAHTYAFKAVIYRLANIVGPTSRHGVVHDFIEKLQATPHHLEILGDGTQTKSYLHIDDCLDALLTGLDRAEHRVEVYNVGSEDHIDVKTIAKIVTEEMGLQNVTFTFTGGVNGGRGWTGDVKTMLLDVDRLKALGWTPRYGSAEAIRLSTRPRLHETT
jgi:UDP-glucose 4-epimerase